MRMRRVARNRKKWPGSGVLTSLFACLMAGGLRAAPTPPAYPQDYRLPGFAFPMPGGRYAIGTLPFVVATTVGEPLRVIAWFPAERAPGPGAPYLDGAEQHIQTPAIARNFGLPAGALSEVASLPTHSRSGAKVASGRFPLLIYSHGYMSYPRDNSVLFAELASEGYVVLSLAHPGDAADIPTADGDIPTIPAQGQKQPDAGSLSAFWNGHDDHSRMKARGAFWRAMRGGRLLESLARWRSDIIRLADAVQADSVPSEALPIVQAADMHRLAYGGWSFGGSSSASACQIDRRCRAAFNLDGFEFDRHLYDRRMRAPLMLIQSDWSTFPNMGPPSTDYTIYDYAYERWRDAGRAPSVYRFRLSGVRHLGLTDLVLAPRDPVRDRIFGPADGPVVVDAVDRLVGAFLDHALKDQPVDIAAVAASLPGVERHEATEISQWHHGR